MIPRTVKELMVSWRTGSRGEGAGLGVLLHLLLSGLFEKKKRNRRAFEGLEMSIA